MTEPLAPNEDATDVIEGGGRPRRQFPRSLVMGFYAVCGIAALAWVGVTVLNRADDPAAQERPTLTVVGTPQPSYRPGHGEFVVTLRNSSGIPIFIDSATISNYGHPAGSAWPFATWVLAKIGPSNATLTHSDPVSWPDAVLIAGHGGTAAFAVTVDPPCGDMAFPGAAQVAVNYHTSSDKFRQIIPGLLNTDPTNLDDMVRAACPFERVKPTTTDGSVSPLGRHLMTVNGLAVSFSVPATKSLAELNKLSWTSYGSNYISKDIYGSQGAEAVVYWTGFPDDGWADLCSPLLSRPVGRSTADLAVAVSTSPGIHLVTGPTNVTVGGHPAKHVVLTVRKDLGCDPGYFYSWRF